MERSPVIEYDRSFYIPIENYKIDLQNSPKSFPNFKFIVNVSAMEGKFYRYKRETHPHTNMAKAALNMMTRTSAQVKIMFNCILQFIINNLLIGIIGLCEV